jgi:kynurenine formamidase
VDEFPPWALCGPAVVVDVPEDGTWHEITPDELEAWEASSGERIGGGDGVLLRTGHSQHWAPSPEGDCYMTNPWPYLDQSGARWLIERGIRLLGVESPDPDRVDQRHLEQASFPTHHALLSAGIPIIENLARLDAISTTRFEFITLSLPITGASGSPVRALAVLPPGTPPSR